MEFFILVVILIAIFKFAPYVKRKGNSSLKSDISKQNSIKFAEEESARRRAKFLDEAEERALKNKRIIRKNKIEQLEKQKKEKFISNKD